jgi:outer membrane protein assembly factor BamE (lipoprotein component of BamABCDE complex)
MLCACCGCTLSVSQQGSLLQSVDIQEIAIGVDTEQTIAERYGQPNVRSAFPDKSGVSRWYYIQRIVKETPLRGKVTHANISLVIAFNRQGIVVDKKLIKGENKLPPTKYVTKENGYKTTFIHDMFANIGKFGQSKIAD